MNKTLIVSICILFFAGCSSTNEAPYRDDIHTSINNRCPYKEMPSSEFVYTGSQNHFSSFFASDSELSSEVNAISSDFYDKKFKFSGNTREKKYKGDPYPQVRKLDGGYYAFASNVQTAVMFEDCKIALWFKGHTNYDDLIDGKHFEKVNGSEFSKEDLFYAYGTTNVKVASLEPKIEIDEFSNSSTISTDFLNRVLLRTWSDAQQIKKPEKFQVYANLIFLSDWGHVRSARTKDGKLRNITKIATDADCSNTYTGCVLTETVGVTLPISVLRDNKDGFEIKFYGTKNQVVKINSYQVMTLLNWIEKI